VSRAIRRFGIVAAAGEIATRYGITGWKNGDAILAAQQCFAAWMEHRKSYDTVASAVDRVKMFIVANEKRFEVLGAVAVENRVGYKKKTDYLIPPDVFRDLVCGGQNPESVAQALEQSVYLNTSGKNRLQKQVRVAGKLEWFYSVRDTILQAT
jgi:uncharacterized protein (DUF927 family)